jgi:hypothetical protein
MKRTVLAILSNRFLRSQKPIYLELTCKRDGTILEEKRLRAPPREPVYDEVWENDDARQSLDSCTRMKRHYRHPLLRPQKA